MLLTLLAIVFSLSNVPVTRAEGPARLYVPADYATIVEALDAAKQIPQPQEVEILVAPGVYVGQLVIDRPHTSLVGQSGPQHDERGFLTGFAAPVEVRNVGTLYAGNIVFINASHVRVEGFVVTRTGGGSPFVGAISAWGHRPGDENEEMLDGIVIRNNLLNASPGIAVGIQQANAQVVQNTSLDDGLYGVIAQGGDGALGPTPHVQIARNHFENKQAGVFLISSVFEFGEGPTHTAPSGLNVDVRDNRIAGAGNNVFAIWRGTAAHSPSTEARLHLQVRDNLLGAPAGADLATHGGGQNADEGVDPGRMVIQWKGNTRPDGVMGLFTADLSFAKLGDPALDYVADSTILLVDADRSFVDISEQEGNLDLGQGYGNTFHRRGSAKYTP